MNKSNKFSPKVRTRGVPGAGAPRLVSAERHRDHHTERPRTQPCSGRPQIGQSGRWLRPVAAAAMRQAAVAEITGTLAGCFQRRRTGAFDPILPVGFLRAQRQVTE